MSLARDANSEELKQVVAEKLPPYMVPRKVIVMDELPHNANGKVDRLRLRGMIRESY